MCWFETIDEPIAPIRVVQRGRLYGTIPSSPSLYDYRADHQGPRPSYTTITKTHRRTRSHTLIPVQIQTRGPARLSVPDYIEYGGNGSGLRGPGVRIIERRP